MEELRLAATLTPESYEVRYVLGSVLARSGQVDEAVRRQHKTQFLSNAAA